MIGKNSVIDAQRELEQEQQKLVPLPNDPEWEAYDKMRQEEEAADPDLQIAKRELPKGCPIPKEDS